MAAPRLKSEPRDAIQLGRIPLTAGGRQDVAEQPPSRAVKLLQLHSFDRIEVVG
jgi:hypothetical protein